MEEGGSDAKWKAEIKKLSQAENHHSVIKVMLLFHLTTTLDYHMPLLLLCDIQLYLHAQ